MADPLHEIQIKLNRYQDQRLALFASHLEAMLRQAQDKTVSQLLKDLVIEDGVIAQTRANMRLIRQIDDIFVEHLERAGYTRLVNAFTASFPEQLPSVTETLDLLSEQAKTPLPELKFSNEDKDYLKSVAGASADSLDNVIAAEASKTMTRVMFGAGGLKFSDMVDVVRSGLDVTTARAKTLAGTAQMGFYRTALDRQYQRIETQTKQELKYRYSGPVDARERPFCRRMSLMTANGKSWTKTEINAMDTGSQPKPVFLFGGGVNCRHQWIPDLKPKSDASA